MKSSDTRSIVTVPGVARPPESNRPTTLNRESIVLTSLREVRAPTTDGEAPPPKGEKKGRAPAVNARTL